MRLEQLYNNAVAGSIPVFPAASFLRTAEIALNTHKGTESIFFKNDNNEVVRFKLLPDWADITSKPTTLAGYGITSGTINNLGVGTTAPAAVFHAVSDSNCYTDPTAAIFAGNKTAPSKRVYLGYDGTNDIGFIGSVHSNVTWKNLAINPGGGNVGIGLINPGYKLEVNGTGRFSDLLTLSSGLDVTGNVNFRKATSGSSVYAICDVAIYGGGGYKLSLNNNTDITWKIYSDGNRMVLDYYKFGAGIQFISRTGAGETLTGTLDGTGNLTLVGGLTSTKNILGTWKMEEVNGELVISKSGVAVAKVTADGFVSMGGVTALA
ncbi:hypothetical protein [uncultured Bacteroides sp.]|uniref:hypothetical protein n=1 Tax=uncultured Bacteroides sp. TaxID=162156 RepID=UPI002AABBC47|nr:hypothetical protein [uncultured Bacteroides sp.]